MNTFDHHDPDKDRYYETSIWKRELPVDNVLEIYETLGRDAVKTGAQIGARLLPDWEQHLTRVKNEILHPPPERHI